MKISADMVEQGLTFVACSAGAALLRKIQAKNPEDPKTRRILKIGMICATLSALIALIFIALELFGVK